MSNFDAVIYRRLIMVLMVVIFVFFGNIANCMDPDKALSDFIEGYHTTLQETLQPMDEWDYFELKNPQNPNKVNVPGTSLLKLKLYDLLGSFSTSNGNRVEGNLMTTRFNGYKEINGGQISFGYDHIYQETRPYLYNEGDRISERGVFDTDKKELVYRYTKNHDQSLLEETVIELVNLDNGYYLLQYFFWKEGKEVSCVFMRYNKEQINFIIAKGDKCDKLEYSSILGSDIMPDEMAEGYTKLLSVKIEGDQLYYQEDF